MMRASRLPVFVAFCWGLAAIVASLADRRAREPKQAAACEGSSELKLGGSGR